MTSFSAPKCVFCKHFIERKGPFSCKAFPSGIPEDILQDGFDHSKPYPNDNGIMFERKQ